jgi:uncharacterized repeat protein (TIGR04076 family)
MERRQFIKAASVVSACALAGSAAAAGAANAEPDRDYQCKITVLRRAFNQDLYAQFPSGEPKACGLFKDGQEFVTKSVWELPEGFGCPWTWAELRPAISAACTGSQRITVACCTDGLRPVTFKLERVKVPKN